MFSREAVICNIWQGHFYWGLNDKFCFTLLHSQISENFPSENVRERLRDERCINHWNSSPVWPEKARKISPMARQPIDHRCSHTAMRDFAAHPFSSPRPWTKDTGSDPLHSFSRGEFIEILRNATENRNNVFPRSSSKVYLCKARSDSWGNSVGFSSLGSKPEQNEVENWWGQQVAWRIRST